MGGLGGVNIGCRLQFASMGVVSGAHGSRVFCARVNTRRLGRSSFLEASGQTVPVCGWRTSDPA